MSNHCRICGSSKLNRFYNASNLNDDISWHQMVGRDKSINKLIRPCECRGEFAFVHKLCLANWIETTRHLYCDVCGFKYNLTFNNRSIFDWIQDTQQAVPILSLTCIALLIYYVSTLGIIVCQTKIFKDTLDIIVLVTAYVWIAATSIVILITCYKEYKEFRVWTKLHQRVNVDENERPQLELKPKPKDVLKSSGFKPKNNFTVSSSSS